MIARLEDGMSEQEAFEAWLRAVSRRDVPNTKRSAFKSGVAWALDEIIRRFQATDPEVTSMNAVISYLRAELEDK